MTALDPNVALFWVHRLLGAGLVLQTSELWVTRTVYENGVLAGRSVVLGLGLRWILAAVLTVGVLPSGSFAAAALQAVLLGSSAWLTARSRGPVGGGSDSMFFQVQLGAFLASLSAWSPLFLQIGLGWIAVQCVLSYGLAGAAKVRHVNWWNGQAMRNLLTSEGPYEVSKPARALGRWRGACLIAGWGVVIGELCFPLVLILPPEDKVTLVGAALLFHVLIAFTLGLNRFFWAWAPTYPAVLAVGVRLGS